MGNPHSGIRARFPTIDALTLSHTGRLSIPENQISLRLHPTLLHTNGTHPSSLTLAKLGGAFNAAANLIGPQTLFPPSPCRRCLLPNVSQRPASDRGANHVPFRLFPALYLRRSPCTPFRLVYVLATLYCCGQACGLCCKMERAWNGVLTWGPGEELGTCKTEENGSISRSFSVSYRHTCKVRTTSPTSPGLDLESIAGACSPSLG